MLVALVHAPSLDERERRDRSLIDWRAEIAQLLSESQNAVLPEWSFVAELRQKHTRAKGVLVSRWHGAA